MPLKRRPRPRDRGDSLFASTGAAERQQLEEALERLDGTRSRIRELATVEPFTDDQEREWRALAKRYRKARRESRAFAAAVAAAKEEWEARQGDDAFFERWARRAAKDPSRSSPTPPTTDDVRAHFVVHRITKGH
ncbi:MULTISPECIES: hypothetical protein [unclassified Agrococcus]|uniref:hypothetical protein n=1 Tax=unclassified Agrococcus TaxID=2615065 RepID=UPI00360867AD